MPREHFLLPEAPYRSYAEYLAAAGRSAVERARGLAPAAVVEEVKRSGLRGRGGAGFPTGIKWASVRAQECPTRYVVCNAAEGEPGTFKDRFLIRKNPYAVIEGVLVAAHAVGAKAAYLALKASFGREVAIFRRALDEMRHVIAGFPITIFEGPEEYLFGEEKGLLNAIEGEGPLPRPPAYPPYEYGLFATPTSPNPALVNNAETFAHAATILAQGADSFRALGTQDTPGTLLATLSGDIARPGVYEVEAGITLRALIDELGGGPLAGRRVKAVLSGVSNGVLLPEKLDTPLEFGSLALAGSGLGSAGFMVYDDRRSMPRVAQMVARFLFVESCNQCFACKTGLGRASAALDEVFAEAAEKADAIERAVIGARHAPQANRCYLPVEGSILIPSLIDAFRQEFEAQVRPGAAAAEPIVCPKLVDFDEATRTFSYDTHQAVKQPDWTYLAAGGEEPVREPTATPAPAPTGDVVVRLAPDIGALIQEIARARGSDVFREVDEALREWVASYERRAREAKT
jgi:NADH:ubiquinone oxidoreductase subunit F (NADH-binding)